MTEKHTYTVPDGPKMLRETLCVAQTYINSSPMFDKSLRAHVERLGRLIDECDRKRPIGNDGKHDDRHTTECGCEVENTPARVTLTDDEQAAIIRAIACPGGFSVAEHGPTPWAVLGVMEALLAAREAAVRAQVTSNETHDEVISPVLGLIDAARDAGMDYDTYSELFDAVGSIPTDLTARIAGGKS